MKIIPYALFITIIFFIACNKDDISNKQADYFIKYYGSSFTDQGITVKTASDGGYLVLATISPTAQTKSMMVFKTDKFGNQIWNTQINDTLNCEASHMILTNENQILVCGTITKESNNTDIITAKLDPNGQKIWEKTYGGKFNQKGTRMVLGSGGNVMVAGSTDCDEFGSQLTNNNIFWIMLSSTGDSINASSNYSNPDKEDYATAVFLKADHNFLIAGSINTTLNIYNTVIVETDANGNDIQGFIYNTAYSVQINALVETEGANIYLLGTSTISSVPKMEIIKLENYSIYFPAWRKTNDISNITLNSVIITGDNEFSIIGNLTENIGSTVFLAKMDTTGTVQMNTTIEGINNETGNSLDKTLDGGYIITGGSTFELNSSITLIKTNALGELK